MKLTNKDLMMMRARSLEIWKQFPVGTRLVGEVEPIDNGGLISMAWLQAVSEVLKQKQVVESIQIDVETPTSEPEV